MEEEFWVRERKQRRETTGDVETNLLRAGNLERRGDKKKTTKKSLFPVSSRTEVSSVVKVGTDCLEISRFQRKTAESVDPLCKGLDALQLKDPPGHYSSFLVI